MLTSLTGNNALEWLVLPENLTPKEQRLAVQKYHHQNYGQRRRGRLFPKAKSQPSLYGDGRTPKSQPIS